MAGFEVIVRPVVFPNIRPQPSRSLPPADDPEQGQAVLSGSSGQVIALSHSFSSSTSSSGRTETGRTVDVARIYQQDDDGNVNKDNFVDVQVATEIEMVDDEGGTSVDNYAPVEESENVEITQKDLFIVNDMAAPRGHVPTPTAIRAGRRRR